MRYLSPDGVGHGKALTWSSWGNVAALLPLAPGQLRTLSLAHAPPVGAPVEAVSSLYEASVRGVVTGELGQGMVPDQPRCTGRLVSTLPC